MYFRLSLFYKFESETHFKSVAAIYNFKLKCIILENIYTSLEEAIFSKTPNPLEIPLKVPITPKYFFRLNNSLHLFESNCTFLN